MPHEEPQAADATPASSRRLFLGTLIAGGVSLILPGCAQPAKVTGDLPDPAWPDDLSQPPRPAPPRADPTPTASPSRTLAVIPRHQWARRPAISTRMKRMLPVSFITVHHSAGPLFWETDLQGTASRLESIRSYHCDERQWGDIGYHFAVDRAGRIWEGRSLRYQGAHVRNFNEGNIGVVALGDFDQQQPTVAQVDALTYQIGRLMRQHGVSARHVRTHREWAPTACPGRNLQRYVELARVTGRLA